MSSCPHPTQRTRASGEARCTSPRSSRIGKKSTSTATYLGSSCLRKGKDTIKQVRTSSESYKHRLGGCPIPFRPSTPAVRGKFRSWGRRDKALQAHHTPHTPGAWGSVLSESYWPAADLAGCAGFVSLVLLAFLVTLPYCFLTLRLAPDMSNVPATIAKYIIQKMPSLSNVILGDCGFAFGFEAM